MSSIKSKDLAKILGVSTATVSLVINGKSGISESTRRKVEKRIIDLGYGEMLQKPYGKEQALGGHSGHPEGATIGFVLFQRSGELLEENSFFPLIMDGIESEARKSGFNLSVIKIKAELAEQQVSYIRDANCSGYVIFATEMQKNDLSFFSQLNLPFVVFDNEFLDKDLNYTKVNNRQGTYLAVKYLVENGHRSLGYLSSGLEINSFKERMECAFSAMKKFGIQDSNQFLFNIGYPNELAMINMNRIFAEKRREDLPTAFLGDNDLVLIGAMQAAKENGYRLPDDFSFIGYDDRPACTIITPKLSTIRLPRELFGAAAIRQLLESMKFPERGHLTLEVNGSLIERESVRAVNH